MHRYLLSFTLSLTTICSFSQLSLGLFGGASHYQGDLVDNHYVGRFTRPAIGLSASYDYSDRFTFTLGYTRASVEGDDQYNTKEYLQLRNLSFESRISEVSLLAEYNVFNLYNTRWSPYLFGGVAVYHFDPYTRDSSNNKVYLKPLSTEGQGLSGYPEVKPYSLTQLAIPLGGGIKYAVSDRVQLGLSAGFRKLFTDYLDDVSGNYAAAEDLLAERGQLAVDYAYRGDEVAGGEPVYPTHGAQRGGSREKDWYYFTGLHLRVQLGGGGGSTFAGQMFGNKGLKCPTVRQ
ncbi:MAG TPA: DUF6089 family protein [Chitinophagaceae bacterium]